MATESIEQLARRLAEALPQGLRSMRDEIEQNFRSILQSNLARLDLVTREEFEVQEAVLARTRSRLEALEERLENLETGPAAPAAGKPAAKKSTKKKKKKAANKKS